MDWVKALEFMANKMQFLRGKKWSVCDCMQVESQIMKSGETMLSSSHYDSIMQTTTKSRVVIKADFFFFYESAWDAKLEKLCSEKFSMFHLILPLFKSFFPNFE